MMKKALLLSIIFSCIPFFAHAGTASLVLSTGKENINALEATIQIPAGVHITSIQNGDSMVLIWVQPPAIDEATQSISFSGLTPGGFIGDHKVLTLTGDFGPADIQRFKITDVTALRNDGKGTAALVTLSLELSEAAVGDRDEPIAFDLALAQGGESYNDSYIVTFLTQDKGSGIDHYEYATTYFGEPRASDWQRTSSPVVLGSINEWKNIFVKAVDHYGNEASASIAGPYHYAGIFLVVLLCIISSICVPSLRKRLRSPL